MIFADAVFTRKILSKLNMRIYNPGDFVNKPGRHFEGLYFIYEGVVEIIDSTERFVITKLPSGSFFGDYNIFFNVKSNFGYRVGTKLVHELEKEETLPFYSEHFSKEEME